MAFLRPKNLKTDHADIKIKIRNCTKASLDAFLEEVNAAGYEFDLDAALEVHIEKLIGQSRKELHKIATETTVPSRSNRKRRSTNKEAATVSAARNEMPAGTGTVNDNGHPN